MSIKVQCDQCRSVMNIREDYAGTKRKCPRCQATFRVPTLEEAAAQGAMTSGEKSEQEAGAPSAADQAHAASEEFDPVAFLSGEEGEKATGAASKKPRGKPAPAAKASKPAQTDGPEDDFDPLEVLTEGKPPKPPAATKPVAEEKPKEAPAPPASEPDQPAPDAEEFDPLSVLGEGPAKSEPVAEASATTQPPKPKRPSWAKPLPEEDHQAGDPAAPPEPPQPRRPSWARRQPGEAAAAPGSDATRAAVDASPAARAAAEAMGGTVVASGPPPEPEPEPRKPWIDRENFKQEFRERRWTLVGLLVTAAVLFGLSWWIISPGFVQLPPLVPVHGKVTSPQGPIDNARVIYRPKLRGRNAEGRTDAEGNYQLWYADGRPGVPPGQYTVEVTKVSANGRLAFATESKVVGPEGGEINIELK